MSQIVRQDIMDMLKRFSLKQYSAADDSEENYAILSRCSELMSRDNTIIEVDNTGGEFTTSYPSKLLIPQQESNPFAACSSNSSDQVSSSTEPPELPELPGENNVEPLFTGGPDDASRYRTLIKLGKMARCRERFPVPVILFRGKYICRSATIANGFEVYARSAVEYVRLLLKTRVFPSGEFQGYATFTSSNLTKNLPTKADGTSEQSETPLFNLNDLRTNDVELLNALNVRIIVDLMVEEEKLKYYLYVSSSEKAEKEENGMYSFFELVGVPYPGCEFFTHYTKNSNDPRKLVFDWSQSFVNAKLRITDDSIRQELDIDWDEYESWDLVTITANYLKLLLKYLQNKDSGILVHCISGWDRTPLFISLLRMSLWADGQIHQSLSATEMLYLTLAYDWLLFGHEFPDRIKKSEMILHFCFNMLKYIRGDDFAIKSTRSRSNRSSGSSIEVLKTDSEIMPEGVLLDGESRGSNASLNSATSFTSGKSSKQDTATFVSSGIGLTGNGASNSISISGECSGASRIGATGGRSMGSIGSIGSYNGNESGSSIGCISEEGSSQNIHWSPSSKRTSPVAVPVTESSRRQRYESASSQSGGSWQMVNVTGSCRSPESIHEFMQQNVSPQRPQNSQQPTEKGEPSAHSSEQQPANADNQAPQSASSSSSAFSSQASSGISVKTERNIRLTELRELFYGCYHPTISINYNSGESITKGLMTAFMEKSTNE